MVQLKKPNSVFCLTASKTASKNEGRKTEGKKGFGFRKKLTLGFIAMVRLRKPNSVFCLTASYLRF